MVLDDKQIRKLVYILAKDPDDTGQSPWERADSLRDIIAIGAVATPVLVEALASPYNVYLSRALIGIGEPAIEPLIEALRDANPVRRSNAAYILGKMQAQPAVSALVAALNDPDPQVRKEAAMAFAQMPAPAAVVPLCAALQDSDPDVRSSAAKALGAQHDERGTEPLRQVFMLDAEDYVRKAAQMALKEMGHDPAHSTHELAPQIGVQAARMLSETVYDTQNIDADSVGIPRVELLVATLESDDVQVQRRAVRELVKLEGEAVLPLISALQSQNEVVRALAAWALGEIGDQRSVDPLRIAADDPAEEVRYAAQQALAKIQQP